MSDDKPNVGDGKAPYAYPTEPDRDHDADNPNADPDIRPANPKQEQSSEGRTPTGPAARTTERADKATKR